MGFLVVLATSRNLLPAVDAHGAALFMSGTILTSTDKNGSSRGSATGSATAIDSWVFVTARGRPDAKAEQQIRVGGVPRRTPIFRLGVKWSQVQILSARQKKWQFRCGFG